MWSLWQLQLLTSFKTRLWHLVTNRRATERPSRCQQLLEAWSNPKIMQNTQKSPSNSLKSIQPIVLTKGLGSVGPQSIWRKLTSDTSEARAVAFWSSALQVRRVLSMQPTFSKNVTIFFTETGLVVRNWGSRHLTGPPLWHTSYRLYHQTGIPT